MEMDILPLPIPAMPHSGFLSLHGFRHAAAINVLSEADIRYAGCIIANQVHVGVQYDGVNGLLILRQCIFKVESMKVHSFNQVTKCFRLKCCESRITNFRVAFKISIVNGFNQLLCNFNNFLLASCVEDASPF